MYTSGDLQRGAAQGESGKFILFGLQGETYGLSLLQIQEIIADYQVTALPNLPEYFEGVISLRGEAIPLMNLRKRFGLTERADEGRKRVIIVEMSPNPIGIQVDQVFRVATIAADSIEAPPLLSAGQRTEFIYGVSELADKKFTILLDMQRVFSDDEKIELAGIGKAIEEHYTNGAQDSPPPSSETSQDGPAEHLEATIESSEA